MINVATIGSSWITEEFIRACQLTNLYHLSAVYSRSVETAEDMATVYKADYYTDELNTILYDPTIDLIYIASPNSLHYEQAKRAIKAGKHVIIEKPMVCSSDQWHELHGLADKLEVKIFEAAKHIHSRNYHRLRQFVRQKLEEATQPFLGANFNIGQYSSRYLRYLDAVENHKEIPNIFDLQMSGGTLMDLGVYPVYVAMDLFGLPNVVNYSPQKGNHGIDLYGHAVLQYDRFNVDIFMSKAVHSTLPSEIYIDDEVVVIHDMTTIRQVDLVNAQGQSATLINYRPENPLYDELMNFADVIQNKEDIATQLKYETWKQLSLQVVQTLEMLRKSADIQIDTTLTDF